MKTIGSIQQRWGRPDVTGASGFRTVAGSPATV